MRSCSHVAEGGLALRGDEIEKNFLFVRGRCVFCEDTEELLCRRGALHVGAPCQKLATRRHELPGFVLTPYCWPAPASCAKQSGLVAEEAGSAYQIEEFVDYGVIVRRADANGTADLEVYAAFIRVVCDIEVEVKGAFLGARLGEFAGVEEGCGMDLVGWMGLDEIWGLGIHGGGVLWCRRRDASEGYGDLGQWSDMGEFSIE
jgi:hypothetical protein